MSLINRITTWGTQILTSSSLNGEFDNIVNLLNNLDGATTKWDQISVANATSVPLTVDNLTGNQNIVNFNANGTPVVSIFSAGGLSISAGLYPTVRVVVAAGSVTAAQSDIIVVVNKTVGAATTVTLPTAVTAQTIFIKDGKGDANSNNITVATTGGKNIDGSATYTISTAYGSGIFTYNGTQWNVLSKF